MFQAPFWFLSWDPVFVVHFGPICSLSPSCLVAPFVLFPCLLLFRFWSHLFMTSVAFWSVWSFWVPCPTSLASSLPFSPSLFKSSCLLCLRLFLQNHSAPPPDPSWSSSWHFLSLFLTAFDFPPMFHASCLSSWSLLILAHYVPFLASSSSPLGPFIGPLPLLPVCGVCFSLSTLPQTSDGPLLFFSVATYHCFLTTCASLSNPV